VGQWTLYFSPRREGETVGDIKAIWDSGGPEEFGFGYSVNLGASDSTDDFIAVATKYRDAFLSERSKEDKAAVLLAALQARMNGGK